MHDPKDFDRHLRQAFGTAAVAIVRHAILSVDNTLITDGGSNSYASCRVQAKEDEPHVRIWEVSVRLAQQKSSLKIGRTITKAAASWAQELGKDSVAVMSVNDDGLSFWPHMGAKPAAERMDSLGLIFMRWAKFTADEEAQKLQQLVKIAREDKETAWFAMTDRTQPDTCLKPATISAIGQEFYKNHPLYFDLNSPVVRDRIGLSPR